MPNIKIGNITQPPLPEVYRGEPVPPARGGPTINLEELLRRLVEIEREGQMIKAQLSTMPSGLLGTVR